MDAFLIVVTVLLFLLLAYISIYLLALYCHPQDAGFGASLFCKLLVVLGFIFTWSQILLLTIDISNSRYQSGLDMYLAWTIFYVSMFVLLVVLIPFAIFFYETDEDKPLVYKSPLLFLVLAIVHGTVPAVHHLGIRGDHLSARVLLRQRVLDPRLSGSPGSLLFRAKRYCT